jgi:hypothetical protein
MKSSILNARNEFTNSIVSQIPCALLSSSESIMRPFTITNWTSAKLSFKFTIIGTSATVAPQATLFYGFCSGPGTGRDTLNSAHCIGYENNRSIQTSFSFFTGNTSALTNPSNQIYSWTTDLQGRAIVTGSVQAGASFFGRLVPRYETAWTNSYQWFNLAGNSWQIAEVDIIKPTGNLTGSWTIDYAQLGDSDRVVINLPQSVHFQSLQPQIPTSISLTSLWFTEQGWAGSDTLTETTTITGMNEAVYGPLNYINIYWLCTDPNAKLAIRDVYVMLRTGTY